MPTLSPDISEITIAGRDGIPVPARTLLRERGADREVHLAVTRDNMHAYLKVLPGPEFSTLSREAVLMILTAGGVARGVIEQGVDLLVNLQNSAAPYSGFIEVASGEPMRKGEDGGIEFHVQPTGVEARYDENDAGAIDFKQLNLIENCFAGQRVASVLPPGPGREGADVFGNPIPPEPGKPAQVRVGAGVTVSPNGRDFSSQVEGRLVHEGGVLSVSPLLEINRDIDYSIGNIDFVGKIMVRGNLLDGFYINAKRGVELIGDMGAARITSEGDVKITGGVKGKNAAIITCHNLSIHYIDDAVVEATGDVTVTKEIMNSSVKSLGAVRVTAGAIIGGEAIGFRGVEADTVGSDMGVTTWVMAGLNWMEENMKDEIRAKLAELLDRVHSAKALLAPLFADKEQKSRLGAEQKALLADLIGELQELRMNMSDLLEERERIGSRVPAGAVNQINVKKTLYMGVNARFSMVDSHVQDSIKGPLSLTQDATREVMSTQAWKELPKPQPDGTTNGEANGEAAE